ncbi:hypothetical protein [Flavobacterium sp.]|uniref:hypothetical protein n=1 Tax=Flavobacterium sp. TaxID=239 RepID=UPI0040483E23
MKNVEKDKQLEEVTVENNLIIGGGTESLDDFLKQQEKRKNLNENFYLEGVKKLTSEINKLIEKTIEDYNVDVFIESTNTSTKVRFNIDLSR